VKIIIKGSGLRLSQNNGLGEGLMAGDIVRLRPDRVFYPTYTALRVSLLIGMSKFLLVETEYSTTGKYLNQATAQNATPC
jgi:hypothetical protein